MKISQILSLLRKAKTTGKTNVVNTNNVSINVGEEIRNGENYAFRISIETEQIPELPKDKEFSREFVKGFNRALLIIKTEFKKL